MFSSRSRVLSVVGQSRAGAHELYVIALEQLARFGVQPQVRACRVQLFDAREQSRAQIHHVFVCGEQWRNLGLDLQHVSSLSELLRFEKALSTRSSSWPERSSAAMVLSNVGGSALRAMASISTRCCSMPARYAGW